MSFQEYKKHRQQHNDLILKEGLKVLADQRHNYLESKPRKLVLEALYRNEEFPLFEKITTCYSKRLKQNRVGVNSCGNVYCPSCRDYLSLTHRSDVLTRIAESELVIAYRKRKENIAGDIDTLLLPHHRKTQNQDLKHITGILGLCDPDGESAKEILIKDRNTWNKVRRNLNLITDRPLWVEVVYEFELVNWKYLEHAEESDYKKKQIKQLIESTNNHKYKTQPFLLAHFHGVTNVPGEMMEGIFKNYYFIKGKPLLKTNADTGLYVQSFRKMNSLNENIKKICSYPFKNATRYKHSFIGSDFRSGERFTDEELITMVKLYDQLRPWTSTHNSTLFKSVSNRIEVWEAVIAAVEYLRLKITADKSMWGSVHGVKFLQVLAQIKHICVVTEHRRQRIDRIRKQITELGQFYVKGTKEPGAWFFGCFKELLLVTRKLRGKGIDAHSIERHIKSMVTRRVTYLLSTQENNIQIGRYGSAPYLTVSYGNDTIEVDKFS